MNDLRNAEGSGGGNGVSERSARQGDTQSAPATGAGLREHARRGAAAPEVCRLEQEERNGEQRPKLGRRGQK